VPITVAARSKAWTVFARPNVRIAGSNPTQGMEICVCVYSVFVYVAALRWAEHSSKESYRLCKKHYETEEARAQQKGCKAIDWKNEWMYEWMLVTV
jgi:hypothetical protein